MIFTYIDPGTGSMLISATVALISVGFFMLKGLIYRHFGLGGSKGEIVDPSEPRNLIIYSEGKQYWSTFQSIVEGCIEEGIEFSYFSSDLDDPGLAVESEYMETKFIGSGREAFFTLNRLIANIMLLTTPGLDVLDLKRSKGVKHYIHINHSTGSMADYKAYGTDYFDSVLTGGKGDAAVIRELESVRNLPEKEVEIVGHTYLDVLRDKIKDINEGDLYFNNERPTILISPTWGMYSLMNNKGDELLERLNNQSDYNVIIRPHPQSFISDADMMKELMEKYPNNDHRYWDRNTDNIVAMMNADLMISDYSGIVFDFYALFKKPILTMHGFFMKAGLDAMDLSEEPWNIKMLSDIGTVITGEDVQNIEALIASNLKDSEKLADPSVVEQMTMYPEQSKERSMSFIKKVLKRFEDVTVNNTVASSNTKESMFANLLMNLIITSAIMYASTLVMTHRKMLRGNTKTMFETFSKYSQIFLVGLVIVFALYIWIKLKGEFNYKKEKESFNPKDFILVLIPLIPIVQYVFANQDILDIQNSIAVLLFFGVIASVAIVLVPYFLSVLVSSNMTSALFTGLLFTIYNMASYGLAMKYTYIILIMLVLIVVIYVLKMKHKTGIILGLSLVLFVTNSVSSIANSNIDIQKDFEWTEKDKMFMDYIDKNEVKKKPNIYLLTYDAYGNEETFNSYGFDNSEQFQYLLDQGFAIYDGTYTIGHDSLKSMSHVLQTTRSPKSNQQEREVIAGKNTSMYFMNKNNYKTNMVLEDDYMFQGNESLFDYTFPGEEDSKPASEIIIRAILEGEFRNDASFSNVTYEQYLEKRNDTLANTAKDTDQSIFYYTHDFKPGHSPFNRPFEGNEYERFITKLKFVNIEMRKNIETIKANDDNAIIVILGDHGAYQTNGGYNLHDPIKKDLDQVDLQDRYGAHLSILWPDASYNEKYDIKLIQDIMPAMYAYMYEDDSLFDSLRVERRSIKTNRFHGTEIIEGIISGGPDDGKPLFKDRGIRSKY